MKIRKLGGSLGLLLGLVAGILPAARAEAVSTVITITSPRANQVIQRDGATNLADIAISGTVNQSVTGLEASSDGASWTPLSVSGLSFNGTLPARPIGRMTVTVRSVSEPAVSSSATNVGIGDVIAAIGDSNTVGVGITPQVYTGPAGQVSLLTQTQVWWPLTVDPVDRLDEDAPLAGCVWVLLTCTHHALYDASQGGSIWPLVASQLTIAHPGLPIGLVVMGRGGSALACNPAVQSALCWQKPTGSWAGDRYRSLYADMTYRLQALGQTRHLRGVLWFEGINDAVISSYAGGDAQYQSYLTRLAGNLNADFGPLELLVAQPGDCDPALTATCGGKDLGLDNVRRAVSAQWSSNPLVRRGPMLYDVSKSDEVGSDGIHYRSSSDLTTAASRLHDTIEAAFYGGPQQTGPSLVSAVKSASSVELNFDQPALTAGSPVSGISFRSAGVPIAGVTTTAASSVQAIATLPSADLSALTVSVGAGRSGQQAGLPRGISGLPAEIVIDQPVSYADPDTAPPSGSVVIAGGATKTTTTTVTLSLAASDNRDQPVNLAMKLSNQSDLSDAVWQPFGASVSWQLSAGAGTKTVYARFRDSSGNVSDIASGTINLVATSSSQAPVTYIGGQVALEGGTSFGWNVRPADLFGLRGNVFSAGVSYLQRNDISRCGSGCVQGSAFALMKPTLYWKLDQGTNTVTVGGVSRQITGGTVQITP